MTVDDAKRMIALGTWVIENGFYTPKRCIDPNQQIFHYQGWCSKEGIELREGYYDIKHNHIEADKVQLHYQYPNYEVILYLSGGRVSSSEDTYNSRHYHRPYISGQRVTVDDQTFEIS